MHTRSIISLLLLFTLATTVCAQTKVSGELKCSMNKPAYTIEIPDQPGHLFQIAKGKCTFTKPFVIEGISAVSEEAAYSREITGSTIKGRALGVGTMANGDKYYISTQASGTSKDGVIQNADVSWTWTGGAGKLKGLKAKGTTKSKRAADGTLTAVAVGEYQITK